MGPVFFVIGCISICLFFVIVLLLFFFFFFVGSVVAVLAMFFLLCYRNYQHSEAVCDLFCIFISTTITFVIDFIGVVVLAPTVVVKKKIKSHAISLFHPVNHALSRSLFPRNLVF